MTNPTPLYIINEALKLLGEDEVSTASFIANSYAKSLLTGLNMVRREIYRINPRWGELEAESIFSTVASTNTYDLSSASIITSGSVVTDIDDIRSLTQTTDFYPLKLITREEYDEHMVNYSDTSSSGSSGKPAYYFYDQGNLRLIPTPDAVYEMTVFWNKDIDTDLTVSDLTSTTIIPFKHESLNMWIWGTIVMASVRISDERLGYFEGKYKEARILEEIDNDRTPEVLEVDPFFCRGML